MEVIFISKTDDMSASVLFCVSKYALWPESSKAGSVNFHKAQTLVHRRFREVHGKICFNEKFGACVVVKVSGFGIKVGLDVDR